MGSRCRELRERLIDEVRLWPALWNVSHPAHKDIDERDKCWAKVAQALDTTDCEMLKREWKILRDSLRQSLKNKRLNGSKTWHFQERMAFLLPHITKRVRNVKEEYVRAPELDETEGVMTPEVAPPAASSLDSVELFFASVCVAARRLPAPRRRQLQEAVLAALHRAEAGLDDPHC